jgi:hypothetical protein
MERAEKDHPIEVAARKYGTDMYNKFYHVKVKQLLWLLVAMSLITYIIGLIYGWWPFFTEVQ